jgi:hypothetical protein
MEANVMMKVRWSVEGQKILSTGFLAAPSHRRVWLGAQDSVAADEAASHDDTAMLRCEEWEARSRLDEALYEHAYSSCDTIEVLSASWLSTRDQSLPK